MLSMNRREFYTGFGLAELLLALLILANIATFTIPKVLSSQQNAQKQAIFIETIAGIEQLIYLGNITGKLTSCNNGTYISESLNAIKICDSDADAQGCWDESIQGAVGDNESQKPAVVLASGAVVTGLNNDCDSNGNRLTIDWNGKDGPNFYGSGGDQLNLRICDQFGLGHGACDKLGTLRPDGSQSRDLYQEIFN